MEQKNIALNIQEASAQVRLAVPTLRKLVQQKLIPCVRVGRRVLFRPESLEAWLRDREVK